MAIQMIRSRHAGSLRGLLHAALLCFVAMTVAVTGSNPALAKVKQPPGSRIMLDVPDSYEISKLFSGFIHPVGGLSIVIAELPTSRHEQIVAGFSDEALARNKITKIERSQLKRDDKHLFLTGQKEHGGRIYGTFILLIHGAKHIAVITANVPNDAFAGGFVKRDDIVRALTSAAFAETPAVITKPYKLAYTGPFKEAGQLAGSAILYTLDGNLHPASPETKRSIVIIAPSVDRVTLDDVMASSKRALSALGNYHAIEITTAKSMQVGGLDGAHLSATAISRGHRSAVNLRQLVLKRKKGGYYRLLAVINVQDGERLLPEVEKMFAGFEPETE